MGRFCSRQVLIGVALSFAMTLTPALAGDLTPPPGPIAATNRVTLNPQALALPIAINQPGSYVLTGNFTGIAGVANGIVITANDVTLDLNGFTINGGPAPAPASIGVFVQGVRDDIVIMNGDIVGWADDGVDASGSQGTVLRNVRLRSNKGNGADLTAAQVFDCEAFANGLSGFVAQSGSLVSKSRAEANGTVAPSSGFLVSRGRVSDCVALNNTGGGIYAPGGGTITGCVSSGHVAQGTAGIFADQSGLIADCEAFENWDGIVAILGCEVARCTALHNSNYGFFVDLGTYIHRCNARENTQAGIQVLNECRVSDNLCSANNNGNIVVVGTANRIDGNDCKLTAGSNYQIAGPGNTIFSNSGKAAGAVANFNIAPGNDTAPIGPAAIATPLGNVAY